MKFDFTEDVKDGTEIELVKLVYEAARNVTRYWLQLPSGGRSLLMGDVSVNSTKEVLIDVEHLVTPVPPYHI